MITPKRIQRKRTPGWQMPENTVYVGRPGPFGNPFNLSKSEHCWTAIAHGFKGDPKGRHAASVHIFAIWINNGRAVDIKDCGLKAEVGGKDVPIATSPSLTATKPPTIARIQAELRGKNLACWCSLDQPCHADVLLKIANSPAQFFCEEPRQ